MLAVSLQLGACAPGYRPVDPAKVINSPPVVAGEVQGATVTIVRDKRSSRKVFRAHFIYDGEHLVSLSRGEVYTFKAEPGVHELAVTSIQRVFFILPIPVLRKIQVEFKPGIRYEYNLKSVFMFGLKIKEAVDGAVMDIPPNFSKTPQSEFSAPGFNSGQEEY